MDTYIKGNVKDIFYKSNTGFYVGLFKIKDTNINSLKKSKSVTFSGIFDDLKEAYDYKFYGSVNIHPKYGKEFKVVCFEKLLPDEASSIISYLSSSVFPNVGEKTAKKIVSTLGNKALDLILDDYTCLFKVPLNEKKSRKIHDVLVKEQLSYKIIVYLQDIGFSINNSIKIYNKYKDKTLSVIDSNIYDLLDIAYMSYKEVDDIALSLNIDKLDIRRVNACIINTILNMCYDTGYTCFNIDDIYNNTIDVLGISIDIDSFKVYLENLNKDKKIVILDNKYTLSSIYEMELFIGERLCSINNKKVSNHSFDSYIKVLEEKNNIKYNLLQKKSITSAINNNLTIITGGPGTGKTTIIKGIIELYKEVYELGNNKLKEDLVLIAPTGRAARRMSITSNYKASTIHSFLKWDKESDKFSLNESNKSDAKIVIIDEASMIDLSLFYNLLKALKPNIKLVIVGDYNQLPSVSYGEVLKDIIDVNIFNVIKLNELYRQKEDSFIVTLSKNINDGITDDLLTKKSDYSFIECNSNQIKDAIEKVCIMAINKGYTYNDIQVLIPMYRGLNGVDNINRVLQNIFNERKKYKDEYLYQDILFREGDKVLLTKNMNEHDISNGDIGIIDSIIKLKDDVIFNINFDDNPVEFHKKDLENLKLGYAITTHKSQGSEFDIVIMPVSSYYKRMLYRKLIYTGVTRAKRSLMLIGEVDAFKYGILNTTHSDRCTLLPYIINSINNKNK